MNTAREEILYRNINKHDAAIAESVPVYAVLLGFVACAVFAIPHASQWLEYDRAALIHGQLWRIITCHWTHFTWEQLIWDIAAFIGIGLLCERENRRGFLLCLVLATICIPLAVWALLPETDVYRGISGIDSALFCYAAMMFLLDSLREGRNPVAAVALVALGLFLGKTCYEYLTQTTLFVQSVQDFVPLPLTHLVGGLAGVTTALFVRHLAGRGSNPALDNLANHRHYDSVLANK